MPNRSTTSIITIIIDITVIITSTFAIPTFPQDMMRGERNCERERSTGRDM